MITKKYRLRGGVTTEEQLQQGDNYDYKLEHFVVDVDINAYLEAISGSQYPLQMSIWVV